jgi:UDP-N-acetylglucosamine 2-epimerase
VKICTVIGARPQFIKAAAISRAVSAYNAKMAGVPSPAMGKEGQSPSFLKENRGSAPLFIEDILIHTGQHYDDGMSAVFFRELDIPEPKYNLNIGSGSHGAQTGRMLAAVEDVLLQEKPDWVLIYGDTNSTLAGALAAAKLHIPIAHVEAGLRSFNRRMPEEINRIVADQLSTLLFCPSQVAVDNLAAEGIPPQADRFSVNGTDFESAPFVSRLQGDAVMLDPIPSKNAKKQDLTPRVLIVGDVMADALQFAATKAEAQSDILERLGFQPQSYLLATVHRAENTDDGQRLADILAAFAALNEPVVFPAHPRTRKLLKDTNYQTPKNMMLIDPLGYFDIIALEKSARMILTDSGGMQKEAYWLNVPCITLRDETEWTETVELGWNILTGANRDRIIEAVHAFKAPAVHPPLYGDGGAAANCLKSLIRHSRESGNQ